MLSIEEILQISNDLGVTIIDNTENKHYILDEYGKRIEFNVNTLMNRDETISSKIELQVSVDYMDAKFTSSYNLINREDPYVFKLVAISESIIDAA